MFHEISQQNEYLMIKDLQRQLKIDGTDHSLSILEPRSGFISYTQDNPESLAFTLSSALKLSFEESGVCFLTIGNSPGSTVGIRRDGTLYTVFDSHSRDNNGRCVPDGKAVVLQFSILSELITYVREMAGSQSHYDQPFEITPVNIVQEATNETLDAEPLHNSTQDDTIDRTQEIPVVQAQHIAVEETDDIFMTQTQEISIDVQTQNVQIQDEPSVSEDCSERILPDISLYDHKADNHMKYLLTSVYQNALFNFRQSCIKTKGKRQEK